MSLHQRDVDLRARALLQRLAYQVLLDGEACRLLLHAELYLMDRGAYQNNRLGLLP